MIRRLNCARLSKTLRRFLVAQAQIRHDHSAAAVDINKIPLTDPVPGFERLSYVDPKSLERFEAKLTVLENGLRIATEPTFGEYATLGVAIDSGSRYEAHYPSGTCHFIEKLAFSSSANYQSREEIFSILENKGALIDCQATRDTFIYASSCHENGVDEIVKIIADGVLRPQVTEEEMEITRQIIKFDNENMLRTPECEPLLMDWAAFQGNTLGFSKFCKPENTMRVTRKHVLSFLSQYYTPERIVLAGVGVDHDYLVEAGKKYFSFAESSWAKHPAFTLNPLPPVDHSIAQYTGGDVRVNRDLSRMALGPTPFPNLSHVVIGFEGAPIKHDDFVPFCVLQALMGGGGSFSAGGPGKGMYTRLYTDVMNRHHWIYNATAFNHSYMDAGLFCIRGSGAPEQ
ncbi:peptidase M16 inactive domain-containing protein, partial [Aphelenchoides avenae]